MQDAEIVSAVRATVAALGAFKAAPAKGKAKPGLVTQPKAKPGAPPLTRLPTPHVDPATTGRLLTPAGLNVPVAPPPMSRVTPAPALTRPGVTGVGGIGNLPTRPTGPPSLNIPPFAGGGGGIDENDPELRALRQENMRLKLLQQGQGRPTQIPVLPQPDDPSDVGVVGPEDPWIKKPFHQMLPSQGWHPPLITKKRLMEQVSPASRQADILILQHSLDNERR